MFHLYFIFLEVVLSVCFTLVTVMGGTEGGAHLINLSITVTYIPIHKKSAYIMT